MSKKALYIPTEEDISILQKIKANNDINKVNIYGYLVAKAIEKAIIDYSFLRYKDISVIDIPEVVHGICYVYPQEILNSDYAKYDADLCHKLLLKNIDNSITNLDDLKRFAHSVQFNRQTINTTIDILDLKLNNNPKYRFNYEKSELLDAIFGVEYQEFISQPYYNMKKLIHIDPIYALKFDYRKLMSEIIEPDERIINYNLGLLLQEGIYKYMQRYDISEFIGSEYDSPKEEETKKLIKYLHNK